MRGLYRKKCSEKKIDKPYSKTIIKKEGCLFFDCISHRSKKEAAGSDQNRKGMGKAHEKKMVRLTADGTGVDGASCHFFGGGCGLD